MQTDFRSTNKGFFDGQGGKKNETKQRDKDRMRGFNRHELIEEGRQYGMTGREYAEIVGVKW